MNTGKFFIFNALVYIILLMFIYFSKRRYKSKENKIYSILIITSFIGVLLELGCRLTIPLLNEIPKTTFLITKLYLVYLLTWVTLLSLYTFIIVKNPQSKFKYTKILIIMTYIINIIIIFYLPINYYNDGELMYTYGLSVYWVYILSFIYIMISIIKILLSKTNLKDKKLIPIIAFIIIGTITTIIQLINPGMLLATSMETFVTVLMYFTIENPDMKMLEEVNKAKKISDNANQEKSMFLFNMTKEIRNISRNIDDHADNILSEVSKEETNIENIGDNAREIKYDISKFNTMTNDILDVSNIDASNIKIYNTKFNIKLIIKGLVSIYKEKCQEKGLEFRTDIASDIPEYLYGDSINLKKVMITLLDNAIKYTNNGYVELNVNFVKKIDICRLIISIEDSGIGIKPEELDTIFYKKKEELNRNNLKNNLYTAKKIITMMEGTIIANSDYNKGTTMKIVLDAKIVPTKENVYIKEYDNKKILLVDDSETCEKIIKKLLRGSNITIERTEYGKYCLDKIRSKEKYDLILIKDELKPLDGYTIMTKLQEIRNFNIPCILLTKNTKVEYDDSYQKYGFKDYIIKSNDKNKILNTLDKYLK
ncbi:MAG: hybrid sensor histidine kinase/response regulator [Bacilli bacterium]|jgi:signal transduction histidine kinase/CheY-like chemotaxis protein|nr:hybrid sensor histidine kinase/response regulator [Bacilli bacterium]